MKVEDLKVGQRVLVYGNGYSEQLSRHPIIENKIGTIVVLDHSLSHVVGVSFDHKDNKTHRFNGNCKDNHGWFVHPENIIKILEEPPKKETEEPIEYDYVELSKDTRLRVSQIINGNVVVKDSKVYKKVKKEYTEMSIKEIEKKLNIKNLKIVG